MTAIGTVIDGKYEILKLIGRGGMSMVYLAMDKRLNKQWAVKEIEKNARDKNNEVIIQSAIAEASMIKRLDHAALPRIVDIIDNGIVIYVIMDYIEGESLNKVLDEFGAQPQDVVIEWAKQLCDVLNYLHNCKPAIIYRDMKPGNIMLKPDGNLKLIDFGIAREYKELNLADTVPLGTKEYAAPEQFGGMGQTDARTDIYCLGVTLHHLVTGQNPGEPPYELYPIRHWNPQLSGGFEKIIQKATQRNPDDRYQSCEELLYALEHYEENDDMFRAAQKKKLNRFIKVISASMICLIIGIFMLAANHFANTSDYNDNLRKGMSATTYNDKIIYFSTAISNKPDELEAYTELLGVLKSDAFTLQEEKNLNSKKVSSAENSSIVIVELKESVLDYAKENLSADDYRSFCYEVGKLYWYYYDYVKGNNMTVRIISSMDWFKNANPDKEVEPNAQWNSLADLFYNIGKFYSEVDQSFRSDGKGEPIGKDKYIEFWETYIIPPVPAVPSDLNDNAVKDYKMAQFQLYRAKLDAIGGRLQDKFYYGGDGISYEIMKEKAEEFIKQLRALGPSLYDANELERILGEANQVIDNLDENIRNNNMFKHKGN